MCDSSWGFSVQWQNFHQLTKKPEGSSRSSGPWHWQNTSMQQAENVPATYPHIPPRGQVISDSTLRSSYKPAVKEKTTNTNPFLRRAAKTNCTEGGGSGVHQPGCAVRFQATAWGWVATEHLVYTKHYGHHIGKPVRNAGLQKGPFMIMRLFALSQSWWLKDQTKTSSKVAPCSYSVKKKKKGQDLTASQQKSQSNTGAQIPYFICLISFKPQQSWPKLLMFMLLFSCKTPLRPGGCRQKCFLYTLPWLQTR